jgi:hypothetical protein
VQQTSAAAAAIRIKRTALLPIASSVQAFHDLHS